MQRDQHIIVKHDCWLCQREQTRLKGYTGIPSGESNMLSISNISHIQMYFITTVPGQLKGSLFGPGGKLDKKIN